MTRDWQARRNSSRANNIFSHAKITSCTSICSSVIGFAQSIAQLALAENSTKIDESCSTRWQASSSPSNVSSYTITTIAREKHNRPIQDPRSKMHDARCKTQDARSKTANPSLDGLRSAAHPNGFFSHAEYHRMNFRLLQCRPSVVHRVLGCGWLVSSPLLTSCCCWFSASWSLSAGGASFGRGRAASRMLRSM